MRRWQATRAARSRRQDDVDKYLKDAAGLDTAREQQIGQHIGYRYDVNLLPDYERLTPYLKDYMEFMGWDDLNWLEDVHMGYEEGEPPIFDRNINGWVRIPQGDEAARQPAGPRHAGARAAGPLPDVAASIRWSSSTRPIGSSRRERDVRPAGSGSARARIPVWLETEHMHGVGQGGIKQTIMPDRCFASGMPGFQSAHFSSDAIALCSTGRIRAHRRVHRAARLQARRPEAARHQPAAEGLGCQKNRPGERPRRARKRRAGPASSLPESGKRPCSPRARWG